MRQDLYTACVPSKMLTEECSAADLPWPQNLAESKLYAFFIIQFYRSLQVLLIDGMAAEQQITHALASNPGFPFRILSRSFGEKSDFLQSCETKSGTESLGSRLLMYYLVDKW